MLVKRKNKQFRINALIFLLSGSVFSPITSAMSFGDGGFFSDSQLDLKLRNVWMVNTTDQLADEGFGDQIAWAQGLQLDFRSGWVQERFGIDASWYGVSKLYANRYFAGRDLVRDNKGHAEGFNKVGQLYAKASFGQEANYLRLYAGWKQLSKFGMVNVTTSRAAPDSWEGVSGEAGVGPLRARAALVTRFSARDETEKRHFYTLQSRKRIDYIATGDVRWQPEKGKFLSWVIGESKDYILRQGIEAAWFFPVADEFRILLRGAGYYNRGLSEWEGSRGFSHNASHYFGLVGYQYGKGESGIGWSKTIASIKKGLGHFYWHFGSNTRGTFNSPADSEGNDYVNDGEQMVHLYSQYQISPQLRAGVYGNYGNHVSYQGVSLHEWEYGGFFAWAPQAIKGLNIFAGFGPSYSWKLTRQKTPSINHDGSFNRAKGVGGSLWFEYKLGLL
ncbi:Outer membrane porin, OprD family [Paramixta manurensis]|uniref:Outer membrane porin, OprD family n=1 Tax=Paramixta manurensis TaxID=2740817 RepID=A0A6M8UCV3_9GAMM|nr:Outer membrane porin, OprD family [Erwiniaceae bacterium PD-1]